MSSPRPPALPCPAQHRATRGRFASSCGPRVTQSGKIEPFLFIRLELTDARLARRGSERWSPRASQLSAAGRISSSPILLPTPRILQLGPNLPPWASAPAPARALGSKVSRGAGCRLSKLGPSLVWPRPTAGFGGDRGRLGVAARDRGWQGSDVATADAVLGEPRTQVGCGDLPAAAAQAFPTPVAAQQLEGDPRSLHRSAPPRLHGGCRVRVPARGPALPGASPCFCQAARGLIPGAPAPAVPPSRSSLATSAS